MRSVPRGLNNKCIQVPRIFETSGDSGITMVENFGNYLRNERELRGIPLEEIADSTKIHVRFLQALESNEYDDLPGEVFIKGYIRSYAKTIGTNVEEILAVYEESVGKERKDKNWFEERESIQQFKQKRKFRSLLFWLGAITIGVLVFILASRLSSALSKPSPLDLEEFSSPQKLETDLSDFPKNRSQI